jgi:hypothetical protein
LRKLRSQIYIDLYRKLVKNETTMLRELVDYAAPVANALLVPERFPRDMWRDVGAGERFHVRMLDMECLAPQCSGTCEHHELAPAFNRAPLGIPDFRTKNR